MPQRSIRAVYVRGGTSRALMFHRDDLPPAAQPHDCAAWNKIFCATIGTPDPSGRQLNGMGGGISSLSKVAVIGPPTRTDADVDYTFAQVGVRDSTVGYRGNCGNISSAVGPFAVDEGLVQVSGAKAVVRIHNTNTGKIIVSSFAMDGDQAAVEGDFELPGVAGTGAPIRLAFLDPGGAATGRLLPSGNARDRLTISGLGLVEVSLVDASNPVVFVAARSLQLSGYESAATLENNAVAMHQFEELRVSAAAAMGLATIQHARNALRNLPLVALVSPPFVHERTHADNGPDIVTRMISAGQPHRASPLTGAMCLAVAARIPGTIVQEALRSRLDPCADLCIGHASGTITVGAKISRRGDIVVLEEAVVYRTARRLMDGRVYYREGTRD